MSGEVQVRRMENNRRTSMTITQGLVATVEMWWDAETHRGASVGIGAVIGGGAVQTSTNAPGGDRTPAPFESGMAKTQPTS